MQKTQDIEPAGDINTPTEAFSFNNNSDLELRLKEEFRTGIEEVIPESPDSFRFLYRHPDLENDKKGGRRIGVLAVSMNPIHNTHEEMALNALSDHNLDELIIMQLRWSVGKGCPSVEDLAMRAVMIYKTFQENSKVSLAILGGGDTLIIRKSCVENSLIPNCI